MSRRPIYRYDEDENLFDSPLDVEEDDLIGDEEDTPFYEDPAYLDKLIEEELGTPKRRKVRRNITR